MGDFNEVRRQEERYGALFNARGADIFNEFISNADLEEVPLGGISFTWCHKSASKMSKLDCFLISEGLMTSCPDISAITLDRYLSDHRSILLRESHTNYGPFKNSQEELAVIDALLDNGDDMKFPNKLSSDQQADLESIVTRDETKRAVWDCGIDKSLGRDRFTFGFYGRYWSLIENDVVEAVYYFFQYGTFPKGGNLCFIALIPKTHDVNMVKYFRPITLIGSLYKIITRILANRLVVILGDLVNEVQSAFVANSMTIADYNLYIAKQGLEKNILNDHSYGFTPQFFAQPPHTPNTLVDKKDSSLEEILDELFKIGVENLKRMGQENFQNSVCKQDVDNISDLEKEEAQEEDGDYGDIYNIWDITIEDVERIKQFLTPNVLDVMDDITQPLIQKTMHTT
uniref:RNA-directed DNA polymerase, eukaryota n=1 Tax=Tanacetum cinerariifolium TaxID=118510 RepID=A0A699H1P7_TANCI|nr:RNA-directed DNA polymerase, eukaryota [Tanacetum cinerariifolium]